VGKSWATAADQASRNVAGVKRPSHKDKPKEHEWGRNDARRFDKAFAVAFAALRGRPSTTVKTTRVMPKKASSRQPRNIAVAIP